MPVPAKDQPMPIDSRSIPAFGRLRQTVAYKKFPYGVEGFGLPQVLA